MLKLIAISFALVFCLYVILQPLTSKAWEQSSFEPLTSYAFDGIGVKWQNDNVNYDELYIATPSTTGGAPNITGNMRPDWDGDTKTYTYTQTLDNTAYVYVSFGGLPVMYGSETWQNAVSRIEFLNGTGAGNMPASTTIECSLRFSAHSLTDPANVAVAEYTNTYTSWVYFDSHSFLADFINGAYAEDTPLVDGELYYLEDMTITYVSDMATSRRIALHAYSSKARIDHTKALFAVFDDGSYDDGYEIGRNEGYDEGYGEGIKEGYNTGFDAGVMEGFEEGAGFTSIDWLLRIGDAVLAFEIIPPAHITIGMIIGVSLGVPLLIWFLKLFAGG